MNSAEMIGIFLIAMSVIGLGFFFILKKIQKTK